jgi:hypothetical protein
LWGLGQKSNTMEFTMTNLKKTMIFFGITMIIGVLVFTTAQAETTNVKLPYSGAIDLSECIGESVDFTGVIHIVNKFQENNGHLLSMAHVNVKLDGYGLMSGDLYQGMQEEEVIISGQYPEYPLESTNIINVRFIGKGTAKNFISHVTLHITINANGEMTAQVEDTNADCK